MLQQQCNFHFFQCLISQKSLQIRPTFAKLIDNYKESCHGKNIFFKIIIIKTDHLNSSVLLNKLQIAPLIFENLTENSKIYIPKHDSPRRF